MNHSNSGHLFAKLSAVLFACYAVTVYAAPNPASKDYVKSTMIGQSVQGGVVFFTYLSDGVIHSLVAASADESGPNNNGLMTWFQAVNACSDKIQNGYSDWFLPNTSQLSALYNNRFIVNPNDPNGNGGFDYEGSDSRYWSSTSYTNGIGAVILYFGSGVSDYLDKYQSSRVRCVRAF